CMQGLDFPMYSF
nr:immunoglobulin light chain junction region [Macaca mulatta]MOW08606.1 immunoglobulin light chain junction region [Macaca mulatta]MOW09335.1 immunoglobulin light chain junction region [Macaca mulatta]MOW10034.1 immunoglobulin light chain junction region [Macaca mulatta]MOW10134.1 immunoglobulin light chain junction region [Macaca mulatta]